MRFRKQGGNTQCGWRKHRRAKARQRAAEQNRIQIRCERSDGVADDEDTERGYQQQLPGPPPCDSRHHRSQDRIGEGIDGDHLAGQADSGVQ